jgi:hypothetical protein
VNTEAEEKAYRRALVACERARAEVNAFRCAADDEKGQRLALARADAEIALDDAALALDAADQAVDAIDSLARGAALAFADSLAPPGVPPLESYAVDAIERYAVALEAASSKAAEREAAGQRWQAVWFACRTAAELHTAERQARGLPSARWYLPANPGNWQELLTPRPAPPRSSWRSRAEELRRELPPPGGFTARRTRGAMRGDLEDARERAAAG